MPSGSSSARQLSAHHSFKDRPDRRGIWTIDGRPSLRESQRFTFKPKVRTYVPPAALPPPKKTLTTLEGDPSAEEALLAEIDGWNAEAERLESLQTPGEETLLGDLGRDDKKPKKRAPWEDDYPGADGDPEKAEAARKAAAAKFSD